MKIYVLNNSEGNEVARIIANASVDRLQVEEFVEAIDFAALSVSYECEITLSSKELEELQNSLKPRQYPTLAQLEKTNPLAKQQQFGGYMKRASRKRW